jgi:hypothetical protein
VAVSWKIADNAWIDAGAVAVDETTVTAVEPGTSPAPNETTAWPSALAALPPEVGVTRAGPVGGEGPLPGFDAGSGGGGVTPAGIVGVAPASMPAEPVDSPVVPGVVVVAEPPPAASAAVPPLCVGASPECEPSVVAGGCPTIGVATVPTLLEGKEVEADDVGAVVGVTSMTGETAAVVGWIGAADEGELVGACTTGSVSCAGEEIWAGGGGDEIAGAGVGAAGEVSPASCNERNSCAPVPALRPGLLVDGSAAGSAGAVEASVAGIEGSGVDAEGPGTGAVAGGVVSAGSTGAGPPTVSSTTPASCCTAVAAALTSTGEPTESSTTVGVVSAAAATAARPLVANGTAGFAAAAADADSSEYASDTTGTRWRTPPPVRAPARGMVRAAAGSAGGACSFGTVSGGNQARSTFNPGIDETVAYAGMRSALIIGVTYRLSTASRPIATSQYRTPRRRRASNE